MEPKQNYFLTGLFVIIGTIALIGAAIWISGNSNRNAYRTYQTFFTESVTGLDEGAVVRYRGVNVGNVQKIEIDDQDPTRIRTIMKVHKEAPVNVETYAVLRTIGITGIAYVQLEGGEKDSQPLPKTESQKDILTIPSRQSQLAQLINAVPLILNKLAKFVDRLGDAMDEGGSDKLGRTMENVSRAAENFADTTEGMKSAVSDIRAAMQQMTQTAATINTVTSHSQGDIQTALKKTAEAMENLSRLIEKTNQFSDSGLSETQNLLMETKRTAREIRDLTRSLKQNPSQIVIPEQQGGVKIP